MIWKHRTDITLKHRTDTDITWNQNRYNME